MSTSHATTSLPQQPLTVIEPRSGWQAIAFRELWQYRELVFFLTWRDVKVRYKQTLLGATWAVIQPLLMMVVFSVFLGQLAGVSSGTVPYPLFVFAGLLPWSFFATAIANASQSVVGSERLITKVYFPRLAVPFAAVAAALVDFIIALGVLAVMLLWYRVPLSPQLLWIVPLMFVTTVAALGVGSLLAALNVAYRDFRYVVPFLVQLWMFATPTIYLPVTPHESSSISLSGAGQWLLYLNPLTPLVAQFRAAVLGTPLDLGWTLPAVLLCGLAFVGSCLVFRRIEQSFADVI